MSFYILPFSGFYGLSIIQLRNFKTLMIFSHNVVFLKCWIHTTIDQFFSHWQFIGVFFRSSTSTRILGDYIYTNASRKNQTKFQPCLCHDRIFFIMVVEARPQCRFKWLNSLFQLLIWCKDTIINVSWTNSWHVCEGFSSDDWCIIISNTHSLP